MNKHLAKAARKNSSFMGRNLEQNRGLGGQPSVLTGWVERERGRGRGDRETQRSTLTTIITITTTIIIEI